VTDNKKRGGLATSPSWLQDLWVWCPFFFDPVYLL